MNHLVEVYAVKINRELLKVEINTLLELVSSQKKVRIKKFHRTDDLQRCLLADILIRILLIDKCKIRNHQLNFEKGYYGKPILKKPNNGYKYNCSHSGNWVVCAVSGEEVGIDVELIKNIDMTIAKRFYSECENKELQKLNKFDKLARFYDIWTLKESFIKWDGRGMSISLDSCSFHFTNDIHFVNFEANSEKCYFKQYFIDVNYKLSVCSTINTFNEKVTVYDIDDIMILVKNIFFS